MLSLLLPAERRGLPAAVVGGVRGVLWEAHWCAFTGVSEVRSSNKIHCQKLPPVVIPPKKMNSDLLRRYHFDMFMLCVNADYIFLSHLPGRRSAAPRCPCSPGRSWCSSAASYGRVQSTSPTLLRPTAPALTPCSSSNSSSLSAGEGPACCVYASS